MAQRKRRGFTIIELVIVIAVIAILAGVLIPTFISVVNKANESVDIQAATNMNKFLATAKYLDGVDSILDVYDAFEDSGYSIDSYKPLYKGRHYYYDKEYNQILYVDDNGKVLFPKEHEGETQLAGHNWFSLSMEPAKTTKPSSENYSVSGNAVTAKVSTTEEYAYVVSEYNKSSDQKQLTVTVAGELDLKGANCLIKEARGKIEFKGEGENAVIKNVTSNTYIETTASRNTEKVQADYYAGGLVAHTNSEAVFDNITVRDVHVKAPTSGGVGILVGCAQGAKITIKNVTIENCSVIGHRDTGALVGAAQNGATINVEGALVLNNVSVKTTGGRSALLVGKLNGGSASQSPSKVVIDSASTLVKNNVTFGIYNDAALDQKMSTDATVPSSWNVLKTYALEGQQQWICSNKGEKDGKIVAVAYGYSDAAIMLVEVGNGAKVITEWKTVSTADYNK